MSLLAYTGTSNSTTIHGGRPCLRCGERDWYMDLFHGYPMTLCIACGMEGVA